ncbi:MAG: TrkA family potassium uptake protein [Clostridia bacterium]|nr:TrkA family potassium uptake protein [Clostridia bacterium]
MKKLYKNFAVLGLGRLGTSVALTLASGDVDVICVDSSKEKIENISPEVTKAVIGDVTDASVLKSLNIDECDVVIVCIGTNLEASLVTCTILKELGAKYIIAKAKSKEHKFILEKIGVDKVVLPEAEIGASIAVNLLNSNKLSYIDYNSDFAIAEFKPKKE